MLAQWRAAYGCPVSDEAKVQFAISCLGLKFGLADVRLWNEHHPDAKEVVVNGKIYLEFFFDGALDEICGDGEATFIKSFEAMIEGQLQEQRIVEFRKKLDARKRGRGNVATRKGEAACDEDCGEGAAAVVGDESDWQAYLRRPVPSTDLKVKSIREAGCMLRFLVCQTSISVAAAEVLGQIAFQEHFPIDGVAQEMSKSTKPLPRWVYVAMCIAAVFMMLCLLAWWQVLKPFLLHTDGSTAL